MNPYSKKDLNRYIESIPPEKIQLENKRQERRNREMYAEFEAAMLKGMCFLCKSSNASFFPKKFCMHWFLYPPGIRKKHFSPYLNGPRSYFRLDAYFRWLANYENPIANINDLKDEVSASSYIETTVRFKNIEWAISVGQTDRVGHTDSHSGTRPHYHIQMKVDDRIFLRFNDFHLEFTDEDLFFIELRDQCGDSVHLQAYRGDGIGILEDEKMVEFLTEHSTVADDENTAPFIRGTIIQAPEGEMLSGDLLADAAEESKRTKEPVGKILQRVMPNAKFETYLRPGDGVPELVKRSGKK